MPARILVRRNNEAICRQPVQHLISKVGGAAPSEIIIDGLLPHAFSLEFVDDGYCVQNTGDKTLYLDENVIPIGNQMPWDAGEVLQVSRQLTLQLEVDSDPAPKLLKKTMFGVRPRSLLTTSQRQARNRHTRLSLMLGILTTVLLFICYQIVFATPDPQQAIRYKFDQTVSVLSQEIQSVPDDQSETMTPLVGLNKALKTARIAEINGRHDLAKSTYGAIRNHLRELHLKSGTDFVKPVYQQIYDYVWIREQANTL